MDPATQLQTIIISLTAWSTISTVVIILTRRDVKLGLKKWFMTKLRRQPIKIRFHGPNQNVDEEVVSLKGKGETLTLFDKKLLVVKTGNGMRFFVDPKAIRRCDDGVNEISYNYKSVMPINPTMTEKEIQEEGREFLRRLKSAEEILKEQEAVHAPVEVDQLTRNTDPNRLNKFVDYVYMAAKADALSQATQLEKWVKITAIGVGIVLIGVIAVYYNIDAKVVPMLQSIASSVQAVGSSVLNL